MELTTFYTAAETATRAGEYRWIEQRLFELMGAWVADPKLDDLEAKYLLGTQSYHHEFLAELWAKRLPMLGYDPTPVSPSEAIDYALSVELWQTYSSAGKLAGLYRVLLPRIISTYSAHLTHTNQMTDGPTVRVLNLCLNDYRPDWVAGEFLLQAALADVDEFAEVYRVQQQVEQVFSSAPGLL